MQSVATLKGLTTAPANLDTLEMERNALQLVCSIPIEFLCIVYNYSLLLITESWSSLRIFYLNIDS